jgi:tetratricopeptide (TPR) repeat protein
MSEGRSWLQRLLAGHPVSQDEEGLKRRMAALQGLGCLAWMDDDVAAARAALEETVRISHGLRDKPNEALALARLSMIANDQADYDHALRYAESSIALLSQGDDPWGMAYALFVRARAALSLGDLREAQAFYEASVNQFRELGDRWGLALPLGHMGVIAYQQGDYVVARRLLEERLSIAREFHAKHLICFALSYLAEVCLHNQEQAQAQEFLKEGMPLAMEYGRKGMISRFLEVMAELAQSQDRCIKAVLLFSASDAQLQALSTRRDPHERRAYEESLADLRARMDEKDFGEAWAAGKSMPLEDVIQLAQSDA